jgi:hypothetical protein
VKRLTPWIGTLAVMAVGLPLLCLGVFVATLLPWVLDSATAEVEQFEPIPAVVFEDSSPGRRVLIEGRLSSNNPTSRAGFVAYTRVVIEPDGEGGTRRREVERVTPDLIVDLGDGAVRVGGGYDLRGSNSEQRSDDEVIEGLRPGDPVLAIGTIVGDPGEELMLSARWVNGTTRAEYLRDADSWWEHFSHPWRRSGCGRVAPDGPGGRLAALNLRRRRRLMGGSSG